jgi:DNA end-binding protein Ku
MMVAVSARNAAGARHVLPCPWRIDMAPRPSWKGYLKLSLVTCPVAMLPATSESEKVSFHTLNRKTGNRVSSEYVDAVSGKPVAEDDEVRGYPQSEDEFVLLEDEELEAVALESARTIDIDMFVPSDTIGWIWYDKPHFLLPDDKVGEEAYAVIRDAMASTKMVGISRVVLYRRERAVMLKPHENGIVVWTLRYGDEVRDPKDYFSRIGAPKPSPAALRLVTKLIDERLEPWSPEMVSDPVQERLRDIIASKKKKGTKKATKKTPEAAPTPGNVVSIMDALKMSLKSDKRARRA